MLTKGRLLVCLLCCAALGACTLPRGAALQSEILRNESSEDAGFAHYEVTRDFLPVVAQWPAGAGALEARSWIKGGAGGAGQVLAAGDMVKIAIWDNGDNTLLTAPNSPASTLQEMQIAPNGTVFVPYVGAVKISGLTPDRAREKIQQDLSTMAPAAQVQLSAAPGRQNSVDMVSGVVRPGNYPMADRSLTVLGLISLGGGVSPEIANPQLRLIRGGKVHEISMERVLKDPALDTGLRGGDKLIVEKDPRYFLALGASGREEIIPFPKDRVTALEAVTLAGGINASRANPKGVLILREYPGAAVAPEGSDAGPTHNRVVFTLNLTRADGLFSAQNFVVQPRDLVLATESAVVPTRTLLGLIGTGVGIASNVD